MRNAPYNLRCNRNKDNCYLGIDSNMPNGNYLKRICKVFFIFITNIFMAILCVFVLFPRWVHFLSKKPSFFHNSSKKQYLHFYIEIMEIIDKILVNDARNLVYNSMNCTQYCSSTASSKYFIKLLPQIYTQHFFLSHFALHCVAGFGLVFFFYEWALLLRFVWT